MSSQTPLQSSTALSTQINWFQAGGHFTPASYSSLHNPTVNWAFTLNWQLRNSTADSQLTVAPSLLSLPCRVQLSTELYSKSKSKSKFLYDWWFTANQFVLASSPLRRTTSYFFQLNSCDNSPYVTSSLTRRWVCLLWICLTFRQMHFTHIACYWKFFLLHYTQVSTGFTEQIMQILRILCYNGSLVTFSCLPYNDFARTEQKTPFPSITIIVDVCLLICCLQTCCIALILLLRACM
jgi:hypothetical protein